MTTIPSNLARVPVSLTTQIIVANLTRTSVDLLKTQVQISSGRRINAPSDDAAGASLISVLDNLIAGREQRFRNVDHAEAIMNTADQLLQQANDTLLQAKDIAITMAGSTADPETRRNNAEIINAMINELRDLTNREFNGIAIFGGAQTTQSVLTGLLGGIHFEGSLDGLVTDLGLSTRIPITLSAHDAFGTRSTRVLGQRDLDPALTPQTRLDHLNGARALGIALGEIEIDMNGLGTVRMDLTNADSVQDVMDRIDDAITTFESINAVTLLEGSRVAINAAGNGISLDVVAGATITITDIGAGVTAADLGLSQSPFTDPDPDGEDLDPRLTELTALADLSGLVPISDFVISNAGQDRIIAASAATTIQDLSNLIDAAGIGVRLEIASDGRSLNIINELSGGQMSVSETVGGNTATMLGIRSFSADTQLDDFNLGRGVEILSGGVDPQTGLPDPTLDLDFRITLSDDTFFDVDLAGAETVADVISIVQSAAPPSFTIELNDGPNGFLLIDGSGGAGTMSVTVLNGSTAAQDLGILGDATGATLAGEDRAKVDVDGLFAHLLALRDALLDDDTLGITFAGGKLEADIDRLAQTRAVLGQRTNRVVSIRTRLEEQQLLDQSIRSRVRDLDFVEASVRFSTLQMQAQATMLMAAQVSSLSLISFLR